MKYFAATKSMSTVVAVFALLASSTNAQHQHKGFRGAVDNDELGLGNGPAGNIGAREGSGPPHDGAGRGKGVGRGVGRPGDFHGRNETLFLNMTCGASADEEQAYACNLPRGDQEGFFVCRHRLHPITGENNTFPKCISPDRGMEGDECGCCGDNEDACPKPCGCTCQLPVRRDGVQREGVEVIFEGEDEEPVCVPAMVSMRLVARSTEDRMVTCVDECGR
jgi:hypothetical protein